MNAWRAVSSGNEQHYRLLAAMLDAYVDSDRQRSLPEAPALAEVVARQKWSHRVRVSRSRVAVHAKRVTLSLTAAAALVLLGLGLARLAERERPDFGAQEFVTGRTERATIQLLDGTVVRLGPESRLSVAGGGDQRRVVLTGRAYFAVAKAQGRSFTIQTPAHDVVVLGTRFDIESREKDLQLVVVEGRVAVGGQRERPSTEVVEGSMYRVVEGQELPMVALPDALRFVEWAGDFLAFQSTPLAAAAREIERIYGVRVEIEDSVLEARVITASFTDRPLDDVLRVVCLAVAAHCTTSPDVVRITSADRSGGES